MPWSRAAQRVLLALAAGLFALGGVLATRQARRPPAVTVADDPALAVRLDLNAATAEDLETLPGVGAALAGRIVSDRSSNGPFRSVEDVTRVPGIGEKLARSLQPYLTVDAR